MCLNTSACVRACVRVCVCVCVLLVTGECAAILYCSVLVCDYCIVVSVESSAGLIVMIVMTVTIMYVPMALLKVRQNAFSFSSSCSCSYFCCCCCCSSSSKMHSHSLLLLRLISVRGKVDSPGNILSALDSVEQRTVVPSCHCGTRQLSVETSACR